MNDDRKVEQDATPDGAVEIREDELDDVSGGAIYMERPADDASLSDPDSGLGKAGQKSVPQDPSIGLLSDPQKKL